MRLLTREVEKAKVCEIVGPWFIYPSTGRREQRFRTPSATLLRAGAARSWCNKLNIYEVIARTPDALSDWDRLLGALNINFELPPRPFTGSTL